MVDIPTIESLICYKENCNNPVESRIILNISQLKIQHNVGVYICAEHKTTVSVHDFIDDHEWELLFGGHIDKEAFFDEVKIEYGDLPPIHAPKEFWECREVLFKGASGYIAASDTEHKVEVMQSFLKNVSEALQVLEKYPSDKTVEVVEIYKNLKFEIGKIVDVCCLDEKMIVNLFENKLTAAKKAIEKLMRETNVN